MHLFRSSLLLACAGAIAACSDSGAPTTPVGVRPTPTVATTQQIAELECTARLSTRTVSCEPESKPNGANRDIVLGGQGQFVNLVSSNVAYSAGVFSFDATVQTLIAQPLATSDGTSADASGVRVFFESGPTVTAGTGTISVANADGVGSFTASNQPYFQYAGATLGADGILSRNEVSSAKTWQLSVDPTVTSFTFKVLVSAVVQHPKGYINFSTDSTVYALTDSAFVVPAQTHAFTAQLLTPAGLRAAGTINWTSSDPSIATVNGTGTVTAVAPGTVTISATFDTLVSRATLSVCPDLSTVGSMYITSGAGLSDICLIPGASTGEYTAVPYNGSTNSARALTFKGSGIQAVTGPPTPNLIPADNPRIGSVGGGVDASGSDALAAARARLAFEQSLRHGIPSQATSLANRALQSASNRSVTAANGAGTRLKWYEPTSQRASGGAAFTVTTTNPTVGDSVNVDVSSTCGGTPDVRRGLVRSVSQHAVIVGDTANPAGGFTTAQYDSIGLEFDSIGYAVDTANFGGPTDSDGNGRVVIFYTRAVNELSPPASSVVVQGYFASKDLFARNPVTGCATSNEGELIYMMVPDPTGAVNSNVRTVSFVRGGTILQLTHNLEHLISASRRKAAGYAFEEAWLDEGLATESAELAFYRTSVGLAPRQNIVLTNLTTGPNASRRVAAFNTYANGNFGLLRGWLQRPDTTGPMFHNSGSLASNGSLWAFLRYSSDRVNGTETSFWYSLVNSNLTGSANLQAAIGGADPLTWARDFAAAMYTDDAISGVGVEYSQPSWNFRSVFGGLGGFPLLARSLTNGTPLSLSFSYQAASYLRFGIAAGSTGHLTTNSSGSTPPSSVAMTIIRTK